MSGKSQRAAPRKAKKSSEEAPLFLEKSYQMVDTSDPAIVGWSDAGDTFVVKDLEAFCHLLPTFFKHNNFRSFVRQLNFYGFRKLRMDHTRPAGWWEFKHDKFLRAQHHLLPLIKRAEHYEDEAASGAAAGSEPPPPPSAGAQGELVAELRGEVAGLEGKVAAMSGTIAHLSELVDALLLERASGFSPDPSLLPLGTANAHDALAKKRKHAPGAIPAKGVFGGEGPLVAGCEVDEAQLLAQLTLAEDEEPLLTSRVPSLERFDDFERSFGGFDFSDGALNDQSSLAAGSSGSAVPLRAVPSLAAPGPGSALAVAARGLSRQASEPSAELWAFLATSLDKLDMPHEPHRSERAAHLGNCAASVHA